MAVGERDFDRERAAGVGCCGGVGIWARGVRLSMIGEYCCLSLVLALIGRIEQIFH
jgi:hypothetical protein